MPIRSGVEASAAVTFEAACSGSFCVNWMPADLRFGWFFSSSSKPFARAAVVDVPAIVRACDHGRDQPGEDHVRARVRRVAPGG